MPGKDGRVLDRDIKGKVERMQIRGWDIGLDGAYNQYRVTNREGSAFLSPRIPNRQLMDWLDAFQLGRPPIPEEFVQSSVDKLLEIASTIPPGSPMRDAILIRCEYYMDLVKAWREHNNAGQGKDEREGGHCQGPNTGSKG